MNPYTYRKGSAKKAGLSKKSFLSELLSTPISSAIAIAMVIFAAGSVMTMTSIASAEIASAGLASDSLQLASVHRHSAVLGDTITQPMVNDSALEASVPQGKLSAKPVNFDTTLGRWDYKISYAITGTVSSASINIGSFIVQTGLSGSGSVETGAMLKPKFLYHVTLIATDSSGVSQTIARFELKTGKGSSDNKKQGYSPLCSQGAASSTVGNLASSTPPTFCVKKDDGSTACTPPPCSGMMPPRFRDGYSSTTPNDYRPEFGRPSGTPPNLPPRDSSNQQFRN